MTLLVVPITVETVHQALAQAQIAKAGGADAVEYRVDRLADQPDLVQTVVADSPLPCIITCRHACETGGFDGPEAQRIALYAALVAGPKPPLALDVEWVKWQAEPQWRAALSPYVGGNGKTQLILSSHDFNGRPADLADRLARMLEEPLCCVPKLAWKAQGLEDCALAMRLLAASPRPAVALAMGEAGMPSRILAKKAGAFMTFAALDKTSGTAPGQPLLSEMKNLYRWDAIKATTKVYGVIGCPVGHSMSPAIHNAGFEAVGFDGVYVPMRIEEGYENLSCALDAWIGCEGMDFGGASVTIPHKENLLRWGKENEAPPDHAVKKIGAANTLVIEAGKKSILNTDQQGLYWPVMWKKENFSGMKVVILGAGGAARAAIAAFNTTFISICNRTPERADALVQEFQGFGKGIAAISMDALSFGHFDIVINCTSLGMTPNVESSPLVDNHPLLKPGVVIFDTVYNPIETKLLKQAKAAGCICIPGTEMFVLQAAAQFHEWTGQDPPLDVFRKILSEKLGA